MEINNNHVHNILIVDDRPENVFSLENMLSEEGRFFFKAHSGNEALKIAYKENLSLILLDVQMPEMDGFETAEFLKSNNKTKKVPIIFVTAINKETRYVMKGLEEGAIDYLFKPLNTEITRAKVANLLHFYQQHIELEQKNEQLDKMLLQLKATQQQLVIEKERAVKSEEFKQQFLANMSHEIRTPMNSILGLTNLLVNSPLNEQQQKHINVVKKASENLLVIINDILDLSKIEAGKMEFERINFVLKDSLDMVYQTLLFKTDEKELDFTLIVDDEIPKVIIGDPVRLNQILLNLTGNAIKFTEKGSIEISAKLGSKDDSNVTVIFFIRDTGIGISKDKMESVFEEFSQASSDTARKYGGTGLGLTISRQLVELQKGYIHAESELGKGTTFIFGITYGIGSLDALEQKQGKTSPEQLKKLDGISILLVEDNDFNQMVAVDTLEETIKNVKIDIAENGKIALEKIQQKMYDVVLMDLNMPEMGGIEATKLIRAFDKPLNLIPIMAMTANVTKDEMDKCVAAGMNDYITKPFQVEELLSKISSLIK